jgi:hypothetical protein
MPGYKEAQGSLYISIIKRCRRNDLTHICRHYVGMERVSNMRKAVMYLNIKLSWRAQYSRGCGVGFIIHLGQILRYIRNIGCSAHTHRTQTGSGTGSPEIASAGLTSKDRVREQRRIYM